MGQYHHPVRIEAEEGLNPHGMDSGLKEGVEVGGDSARNHVQQTRRSLAA
jgi:hypothetical protein